MKAFLDTSVLVAVFQESHEHHQRSFDLFAGLDRATGSCAAHSLAEFYAVATGMPGRLRVRPEHAILFVENLRERLTVVGLDADEYGKALTFFSGLGVTGGTIYDALLAQCALKARAKSLYSWNLRHWQQLGPQVQALVKTPP